MKKPGEKQRGGGTKYRDHGSKHRENGDGTQKKVNAADMILALFAGKSEKNRTPRTTSPRDSRPVLSSHSSIQTQELEVLNDVSTDEILKGYRRLASTQDGSGSFRGRPSTSLFSATSSRASKTIDITDASRSEPPLLFGLDSALASATERQLSVRSDSVSRGFSNGSPPPKISGLRASQDNDEFVLRLTRSMNSDTLRASQSDLIPKSWDMESARSQDATPDDDLEF